MARLTSTPMVWKRQCYWRDTQTSCSPGELLGLEFPLQEGRMRQAAVGAGCTSVLATLPARRLPFPCRLLDQWASVDKRPIVIPAPECPSLPRYYCPVPVELYGAPLAATDHCRPAAALHAALPLQLHCALCTRRAWRAECLRAAFRAATTTLPTRAAAGQAGGASPMAAPWTLGCAQTPASCRRPGPCSCRCW